MNELVNQVDLWSVPHDKPVIANIVKLTRELAQAQIDGHWWASLGVPKNVREKESDHAWRWAKRLGELKNDRWHEAVAIQTDDGKIQGAMLYWSNTKSFMDEGNGAVYIEALATAPRNRAWLVPSPQYRRVGTALILRAVSHSNFLGLKGVVNLEAFNEPLLLDYYRQLGFMEIRVKDGLPQMELSAAKAVQFIRKAGYDL
ncbi:MAG: hypothetical protein EXS16_20345 [Gemmataceae bacterium]|nr:hypothetical protein [Gemmataceae bacterium]